jgi:hypothetical protein
MSLFQGKPRTQPEIPMREFLERIVEERDKQYDMRFRAAEIAVNAALAAQQKSTADAFSASEKAIIKAEDAQKEYNLRSNEFRGQLDDQAKLLMQRQEALGLFKASDDKLEAMRLFFDSKMESLSSTLKSDAINLDAEIKGLRESRSEISGKASSTTAMWGYMGVVVGIIVAVAGIVIALILK